MIEFTKQNFWFNKPIIPADERILFEVPANHTQGRRAVGGKMFVTDRRILFIPNRLDGVMGGNCKQIPNGEVSEITKSKPVYSLLEIFSGAFRSRLCVVTKDHNQEFLSSIFWTKR